MFGKSKARNAFAFLETEFGFRLREFKYSAWHFGDFTAEYDRPDVTIAVSRNGGRVIVELTGPDANWCDKEDILEELGVRRDRYPTRNGIWAGYELANQVAELRRYLPQLLAVFGQEAPRNGGEP